MQGHLLTTEGELGDVSAAGVQHLLDGGSRFWLDISDPSDTGVEPLLRDTFRFHPLAVEDAEEFGQRPKLDAYDDFALLVVYGADPSGRLVEMHCFYTDTYLVTVHRQPCAQLDSLIERLRRRAVRPDHIMLLYYVVDALIDGYFPMLEDFDDKIDALEDEILERPTDEQLGRLFDMKRSLIAVRKVVTPQRDLFATFASGRQGLPAMDDDTQRYFRDLYDHLIRISDLVDSYRDLLTGALDTHLSTVSNRLNVVMKQLAIIATIFLPMSFLTGFFGQNFGWLTSRIDGGLVFYIAGIGLQVAVVIALFVMFRRRGWLSSDGTVPPATAAVRPRVARDLRWHLVGSNGKQRAASGAPAAGAGGAAGAPGAAGAAGSAGPS